MKDENGVMCILSPRGYGKTYYELEKLSKQNQQLQNNWNELKEWLKEEHFNYKTGWFTQDMATTYRVDGHINALEIVSNKMQEIESRK